jgi:hypothetical protein
MSEAPAPQTFSRRACLADFFAEDDDIPAQCNQNKYNKHHSQNDNVVITKNQQEFGHRKRIKP